MIRYLIIGQQHVHPEVRGASARVRARVRAMMKAGIVIQDKD